MAHMDDGALTDAPGCKGRSGDELESEPDDEYDDSDGMEDADENPAATEAEAEAVNDGADILFTRAIKDTVAHMVNPALPPAQHVPAPIVEAVVEMLTANMQARAARYVAVKNARAKAAHKRELSRLRMQKLRRKRAAGGKAK